MAIVAVDDSLRFFADVSGSGALHNSQLANTEVSFILLLLLTKKQYPNTKCDYIRIIDLPEQLPSFQQFIALKYFNV